MDMIQDYNYAVRVLQDLGYTIAEASKIIEVIKQGNYAFPCKKAESVDSVDLSKQHIWMQDECTGIDVPVLWKPNQVESSKTIILLAQDPLRDNDYWDYSKKEIQHNKHVIIGTPYALHISEETKRTLVGTKQKSKRYNVGVYRMIIEALCKLNYNVYCTDIFKYYMRNTPCEEVSNFDVKIFKNEYKRIGPVKIIAMGKSAQAAVAKLEIEQNKIISVLHPKARPQRETEQIVKEIISKL
jgi:hypothetical protein